MLELCQWGEVPTAWHNNHMQLQEIWMMDGRQRTPHTRCVAKMKRMLQSEARKEALGDLGAIER
jgi:hypothetical protein